MHRLLYLCLLVVFHISVQAQDAQNVKLLCNWNGGGIGMPDHNGQYFNDVWGFTWNGKEYAAIGSTVGVHIIDVDNCKQVAYQPGHHNGRNVIHRDYKIYKNYLYAVCDEGDSRLQIFDISSLPFDLKLVYESSNTDIERVHNIFIDTAKAKLYLGILKYHDNSGTLEQQHMGVYSLANPTSPKLLTYFDYDFVHDMYVRNDTAYCSASTSGYVVVDFSKDTTYEILGVLPAYDYKGYNHSSWVNSKGVGVIADETHGMPMKVINTNSINNIEVVSYFMPRWLDTTCIPHNPYILNEDYVLISYYFDGLQIYNISNPDSPYRTGYYDTYPETAYRGYAGAWGCYPYLPSHRILVSDMQTGLYVFNADSALGLNIQDTVKPFIPATKDLVLYPNPVKDKLTVIMPEQGRGTLTIYDITGKCILKQTFYASLASNQAIELPLPRNFPAGVYMVRVVMRDNSIKGNSLKHRIEPPQRTFNIHKCMCERLHEQSAGAVTDNAATHSYPGCAG